MTKPKKPVTRKAEYPPAVVLRMPPDLTARIDALLPAVAADTATAAMLGRLSRSAIYRLALIEGLKVLERRHKA